MADTKEGREKQARTAERRQQERELQEARERLDEPEPDDPTEVPTCRRRDCSEPAEFVVLERYQEETGHGAVEAEAVLCRRHTAEERPTNLDHSYDDYVFRIEPLAAEAGD